MASKQVLTAHPAVSNPVKVTDANTLSANMAALRNLAAAQLKAVAAQALCYELQQNGGTDYRTNHAQLRQDATSFFGGISLLSGEESASKTLAQTALDWYAGYHANAALGTDPVAILAAAPLLAAAPEETLNRMLLFLRYKLAV